MNRNLKTSVSGKNQEKLMQLADFPENNPNPIVQTDSSGEIYYINPAAKKMFPDLKKLKNEHPYLSNLGSVFDYFKKNPKKDCLREIQIGNDWFQQQIYFVPKSQYIRIYGQHITQHKRYLTQIMKITQLYSVVSKVNEAIIRAKDEQSLFNEVCKIISETGAFPLVWIGKIDGINVWPVAYYGPASNYLKEIKIKLEGKLSRGPTGTCIHKNKEIINDDFDTNPSTLPWRKSALKYNFRASAAFPLHFLNKPIGALALYASEPKSFDPEKIKLLRALSADISYALDSLHQEQLRNNAEEKLRESEKMLKKTQEIAHVGTWAYDNINKQAYWSDETFRIYGYQPQEVIPSSETFNAVVHPDDRKQVADIYNNSAKTGKNDYVNTFRVIKKITGELRTIYEKCEHIRDESGKVIRSIGMVQDITEQTNAEKALQESEEKFRSVAETAKDAIISADSKGQITYFNRGAEQIFGYSPPEVFGKHLTILMPEQLHEPHFHGFSRFMQTNKPNIIGKTVEIVGKKKNGDEFPVELSLANWFIGNDIYFTAIIRDITERKSIDQRKDDFITIAGHELRTPLSAIRIINQILQGMFTDNPQALKYLAKIERQSEIEANLIDDLLNVSKIQTGKLEIHKEEFELRSLIKDVAETMQKTTRKHKIVLKGKTYAKIFTDKDRVAQVLTNFCTNAIKYSPKEGKIIIELKKDKKDAIVSVIDFGIGIPKEHHHGIFKKFYRVYGSGNEGYPGLGMGLYISYQIIKLLNGNMWFESTPEKKGSTFYFSVPLA